VSDEETGRCQEDSLHRRAASIEKHNLHRRTEDLCNQLVAVYTKMVSLFVRASVTFHTACRAVIYRVRKKKRVWFTMLNYNKFKYIFVVFGKNHPDTSFY